MANKGKYSLYKVEEWREESVNGKAVHRHTATLEGGKAMSYPLARHIWALADTLNKLPRVYYKIVPDGTVAQKLGKV